MGFFSKVISGCERMEAMFRRRSRTLRQALPFSITRNLLYMATNVKVFLRSFIKVKYYSQNSNIYHCCIHKTGSQWMKSVLSDPVVFEYSGLKPYHLQVMRRNMAKFDNIEKSLKETPLPERSIVSTFYMEFGQFDRLNKTKKYKSFFVIRDPRELVVSWYFSALSGHILEKGSDKPLYLARLALKKMSLKDGLKYAIDFWVDRGKYDLMLSWVGQGSESVKLVKYEDFISSNNLLAFNRLFDYLDIKIPEDKIKALVEAYSFSRLSGRKNGETSKDSHLRSGVASSWKNYFDDEMVEYFDKRTDGIVAKLGY